ncbi:MAG: response regulator [Magnetococcales bacterium]|nr:response regulator [Magnetococcales bacterium]MBF0116722.1 response regulator [Magnetococcales bacterium]
MQERLLIVDDDEIIVSVARRVLTGASYRVDFAEDGMAAWHCLEKNPTAYDLILLDRQMPRLDGLALLKRLKQDRRFQDLPVVMLTSMDRPHDIVAGLNAGAHYYLTKPLSGTVLNSVIRHALQDAQQKIALRTMIGERTNVFLLLQHGEFHLQTLRQANEMAVMLAEVTPCPNRTVSGYAELLVNAIEHGNLAIDYAKKTLLLQQGCWLQEVENRLGMEPYRARFVTVQMEKQRDRFIVTIQDQGEGFNWHEYLELSPERAFDLHGRGVALSNTIYFDHLEYCGKGNIVVATVNFS